MIGEIRAKLCDGGGDCPLQQRVGGVLVYCTNHRGVEHLLRPSAGVRQDPRGFYDDLSTLPDWPYSYICFFLECVVGNDAEELTVVEGMPFKGFMWLTVRLRASLYADGVPTTLSWFL